ncbi:alpha/beta fold hydrolase [uncultured Piscinibacter sp.]|uniref:alpha/beta hydrolase n=1 Tax=uncultured Piscinibacter sp. TaxID=1131835 RepID=UPI0026124F7B|nr:alpha/beta fold hydrolase [uncultured Piscinibacter sp.]
MFDNWFRRIVAATLLPVLVGCATAPSAPQTPAIAADEFQIPSKTAGVDLFVRNKRPAGMQIFASGRIVLFVHGATFPSESTFDIALDGLSWMDFIARSGYDVYLVDVRGYGGSTRPAAGSESGGRDTPIATLAEAVEDVDAAVDFIRRRRNVERINLIGWSWGTQIMGRYAASHAEKVDHLVLYAPLWQRRSEPAGARGFDVRVPYRHVNVAGAKSRWLAGVAEDKQEHILPPGRFETWVAANLATDPWGSKQTPPVMRAPNGVFADLQTPGEWVPPYNPAAIKAPTLLIKAEWDADTPGYMAQTLFPLLVSAPRKQYVEIGEGTHTIMLERNRMQLFHTVQMFLDGPRR